MQSSRVQLSEIEIIEKIEKVTDPDQPEGEWITKIDLMERVLPLRLHSD